MASGLRLPVVVSVSATNVCCCRSDGRDPPQEARLCSPQAGLKTTVCFASRLCRPGVRSPCCPPRPDNSRCFHSCIFVSIRGSKRPAAKNLLGRSRVRKPELQKFVSIRAHSCPFVFIRGSKQPAAKILQGRSRTRKHELQKFVSIRVHSWFKTPRSEEPSGQNSGSKARATGNS
jgi:hypothetical protein